MSDENRKPERSVGQILREAAGNESAGEDSPEDQAAMAEFARHIEELSEHVAENEEIKAGLASDPKSGSTFVNHKPDPKKPN